MVPVARRNLLAEKGRLAVSVAGGAFSGGLLLAGGGGVRGVSKAFSRTMSVEVDGKETPLRLMSLERPPDVLPGQAVFFPPPGRINIDAVFAEMQGLTGGDTARLNERELEVGDTFTGGNTVLAQFAFVDVEDARAIFGVPGTVPYLLVSVNGPKGTESV